MSDIRQTASFVDAPGGDLSLDDIFADVQASTALEATPPPITNEETTFLKTTTGSVYKTAEDAVKGIEHKDTLIAELRQQLNQATGSDPLKKNQSVDTRKSYQQDKDSYFKDLSKAVEDKNPEKYMEVQSQFILDTLAPLGPTISSFVRSQAIETVEQEITDFRKFATSNDYKDTLESYPLLRQAIEVAESNPQAGSNLPEFYKLAYHVHNGRKLPELVQNAANASRATQTRPTVQSTTVSAPPTNQGAQAQPSLDSKESRKALIDQYEKQGIGNFRF